MTRNEAASLNWAWAKEDRNTKQAITNTIDFLPKLIQTAESAESKASFQQMSQTLNCSYFSKIKTGAKRAKHDASKRGFTAAFLRSEYGSNFWGPDREARRKIQFISVAAAFAKTSTARPGPTLADYILK